jgi:acyl-CoA reductase-like NAD-dependent aldehyde dehydrogenase
MNDSKYGLTASIWSKADPSSPEIQYLLNNIESGTVFLNRADYLDPALAWGGLKDSGRGVSLSTFGYDQLIRLKSVHLKIR